MTLPGITFTVSRQTPLGTFIGDWQSAITRYTQTHPMIGPFTQCTNKTDGMDMGGVDRNLYVGGDKPASVYAVTAYPAVSDGGSTYRVFTNPALEAIGIGFIVRWRVTNGWGDYGQWVTPPANWIAYMPPPSAGMEFWRTWIFKQIFGAGCAPNNDIQGNTAGNYTLGSLQGWYDTINSYPNCTYMIIYGAEIATRYVLIKDPLTIAGALPLDPVTHSVSLTVEVLKPRPGYWLNSRSAVSILQPLTITLPATGTCTTPSADETTVNLGTVFANEIPQQGDTSADKPFTLTFRNCPRINIGYYLHANGKWVDSAQGIVGLPGSTPNANPAVGNPRGFGVQVLHNNSSDGNGPVYISPNVNDANKQVYWRTPAQGTNSATGVTHTIALRARVIRTHPADTPIVPGPFNTSLIFVVQYP